MVRRVSPACGRFLLASVFVALSAVLLGASAQAQSNPVLARTRSWAARMENRWRASLPGSDSIAVRFGRDLAIPNGESRGYVACFLCSTRIDGAARKDLLVFAGNAYLNGPVQGDVIELGGRVSLTSKARIGGDLIIFGGRLEQDAASTIGRKRFVVGPIVFLPMLLIVGAVIAGLILLLQLLFGRFGAPY